MSEIPSHVCDTEGNRADGGICVTCGCSTMFAHAQEQPVIHIVARLTFAKEKWKHVAQNTNRFPVSAALDTIHRLCDEVERLQEFEWKYNRLNK